MLQSLSDTVYSAAKKINQDGIGIDLNSFTTSQPRGLYNFISEIRSAKSKEDERTRVDKELGNIRAKFATSQSLSSRDKKKYIWKMCYMYMLGYEIDFGHTEFIALISSTKFQEKSVGYMAFSLMIRPGDELMTLLINSMRNDIIGQQVHGQTLALAAVSNVGGNDLAECLASDVQKLISDSLETKQYQNVNVSIEEEVKNTALLSKKASLCLLRLFRTNPECIELEDWLKRMARLLENRDFGVVTSVASLLLGLASYSTKQFEPIIPYIISVLNRLTVSKSCPSGYLYYKTPSPWLQVKCLRFLQYYKLPTDVTQTSLLMDVLRFIIEKTEFSDSNNKSNADHAILFEVINLAILYGSDAPPFLKEHVSQLLGRFIAANDANIKYLALDAMTRLVKLEGPEAMQVHQTTVLDLLRDQDSSVRKRALDLIYVLTDHSNAKLVVEDLLTNLAIAESSIKEDLVVKIAILAETYSTELEWYVSSMVQVLQIAGDFVAEAVWYRIVQIITNNPEVHEFAAKRLMISIEPKYTHDTTVAVAAYLLGEIGVNICEEPGTSGFDQFATIHQHFTSCSVKVQCIMLSTYMKLLNLYPEQTSEDITAIFVKYSTSANLELQQRACENLALPTISPVIMESVLNSMPPFPEKTNTLLSLVGTSHVAGENADKIAFADLMKEKEGDSNTSSPIAYNTNISDIKKPSISPMKTMDLLSMDDDDIPAPAPVKSTASSILDLYTPTPSPPPVPQKPSTTATASNPSANPKSNDSLNQSSTDVVVNPTKALHAAILTFGQPSIRSMLLQNNILKIYSNADYKVYQGRLLITIENISNSDIANLKVATSLAALSANALTVKLQEPSSSILAKDEDRFQLAIECTRPFADAFPLSLDVSFSLDGSPHTYSLKLPVTAPSFFEALPTDKATYMNRWKSIEGEGTEAQAVFTSSTPIDAAYMQTLRTTLVTAMKLGLAEGIDNEKTLTGSSSFLTGTVGPDGKNIAVGVMMRLEGDYVSNKFRITVRAKNGTVAQGLKNFILEQLS